MAQPDILVPLHSIRGVCAEERRCAPKLSYFWAKRALIRAQITLRNFDTIKGGKGVVASWQLSHRLRSM